MLLCESSILKVNPERLSKIVADDILIFFYYSSEKIYLPFHMNCLIIHMKCQPVECVTDSVEPDQIPYSVVPEDCDLGLHCSLRCVYPNASVNMTMCSPKKQGTYPAPGVDFLYNLTGNGYTFKGNNCQDCFCLPSEKGSTYSKKGWG